MRKFLAAALAGALMLPLSANAMLTFPVIMDATVTVPLLGTQSFVARFQQNGTVTMVGQTGTWDYDAQAQTLTVTHPLGTAVGVRNGLCFDGTITTTAFPIPVPFNGCVRP
jgi:hypothetical protein